MISYRIVSKSGGRVTPLNKPVSPKDPEFKELVFRRAMRGCTFKEGDTVKIKGTPKRGTLIQIIYDINDILWVRNRPYFLEVEIPGDEENMLYHPSQLKRLGQR